MRTGTGGLLDVPSWWKGKEAGVGAAGRIVVAVRRQSEQEIRQAFKTPRPLSSDPLPPKA